MRFLCLHGLGTNSQVLESQTAALRYELGDSHTYDYAEGNIACPMAPEIASYFPNNNDYYAYFNPSQPGTFTAALDNLETFIARDGPYDAVIAYSHGAQLVASMLIRLRAKDPYAQPFKCAIFISGGIPYQYAPHSPDGHGHGQPGLRFVDAKEAGVQINIHTANIWGRNDTLYPGTSEVLSELCRPDWNTTFVHEGGHDIPSSKNKGDLLGCVKAIRRMMDQALSTQ